jgi:Protein of unknown function (DUF4446)
VADLTSTPGIVAVAACVVAVLALVVAIGATVGLRRVRTAQSKVLGATGDTDLIAHAAGLHHDFEALNAYVQDVAAGLDVRLGHAEGRLDRAIAHRSLVRYDAYNEMSGRQSTTIALLDAERSGIVLSSIHHRDQARLYVKQIVAGRGELELSPEELAAVEAASDPAAQAVEPAAEPARRRRR